VDFGNEEERERHMAGVLLEDGTGRGRRGQRMRGVFLVVADLLAVR